MGSSARTSLQVLFALFAWAVLSTVPAAAQRQQMGPQTNYSAAEIAASVQKTSLNANLKQYSNDIGALGRFESNGNSGIYNGSCCTGVLQVNRSNLKAYGGGITPQQYANMSLDQQTEIWAKVTNAGANSAAVRKLQSMKEFDGQPVDGSLVLSCIQLGVGNCQKMLDAGHCGGFRDSNGTSICDMANKMRKNMGKETFPTKPGEQKTPATSTPPVKTDPNATPLTGNPVEASLNMEDPGVKPFNPFDPQEQGTAGSMTKIGDPTVCWICDAVARAVGVAEKSAGVGLKVMFDDAFKGLAWFFVAIALCYMFLRAMASGANPFGKTLAMFVVRVTVVMTMVSSPDWVSQTTNDIFISAPIEAGSDVGKSLGDMMATSLGYSREAVGCSKSQVSEMGVSTLTKAAEGLVDLSCTVHVAASTGILLGGLVASHPTRDATVADKIMAAFLLMVGLGMMYLAFIALLNFGFALMETVIVTAVIAVFVPAMLIFYMFDSTKGMMKNAFENVLFVFINLVFASMGAVLMLYVMMLAMSLGLSDGNTVMTTQEIVTAFANLVQGKDITQGEALGKVVKMAAFSVAGFMIGSRVLQASQSVAMEMSGHALGQAGALAKAGSSSFAHVVKAGMVTMGVGATVGGRVVGAVAGKAAGAAFTSGMADVKASGAFTKLVGGAAALKGGAMR